MKTALVTGSSRGIGRAIIQKFAQNGCAVAINYINSREAANNLAGEITVKYKVPCKAYRADVKIREETDKMIDNITRDLGGIEILVNNAGISSQKLFTDIEPREWREMLDTHLLGAYNCTQAVLPGMIRSHSGKIVNISSVWGVTGGSCEVHYSTAKAGIIGFTKSLAKEVAPSNINVNCVCPGAVDTDMLNMFDKETLSSLAEETSLKRLGTVWDVANAVSFLASGDADYITGAVLNVNGGYL